MFGILSLLIVVAIVGLIAKKQLTSMSAPASASSTEAGVAVPTGTPKQQVEQYKKAIEGAMQQPRPLDDGTK
jgi:hypothetical protein